jgi:single-stranded-DNA-specific exonuclease
VLKTEPYEQDAAARLVASLNLPPLVAQILSIRGIATPEAAEKFLYPSLEHLSDPFLLPDIDVAIKTIVQGISEHKKIGVFGDYDADGITSCVLMVNFLNQVGVTPEVYLPKRAEGYGLNEEAVCELSRKGVELIICLDCGSSNVDEITIARQMGLDVVVIDHHEIPGPHPPACALVNPKRKDSLFPSRELAACGVTFFVLLALRRTMDRKGLLAQPINLKKELDIVTVGTVADMVPLMGDNRILVKFGMDMMQKHPKTWLKSFFRQSILSKGKIDAYALSFVIIPRINAAGRVSDPLSAFQFLIATDQGQADTLLGDLDKTNKQRQSMEEVIVREAQESIEEMGLIDNVSLVLRKEHWPVGVIGIAAQKLAEAHKKPCIIFTKVDGIWKGSARSVPGLDLHSTVSSVSSLLLRFGGHKYACGLSMAEENAALFNVAFEEAVQNRLLGYEKSVTVDAAVEFDDLSQELVEYIELLAPFGYGNPRPNLLFSPSFVTLNNRFVKLTDNKNRIWYGNLQKRMELPSTADVRVIACPTFKGDLGEKFIHFQIREFVSE